MSPLVLLGVLMGLMIPVQAVVNAQLARVMGSPITASFLSFMVGTGCMALVLLATRSPAPTPAGLAQTTWWMWLGGILGAFYVTGSIFVAPRIGALSLFAALV